MAYAMPIADGKGFIGPPLALGTGSSAVTGDMLAQIHGMNRLFLDLSRHSGRMGQSLMPPSLAAALEHLPEPALDQLAHCAFALFDLEFGNGRLWQRLLCNPAMAPVPTVPAESVAAPPELDRFLEAALGYAWHLCQGRESAARQLFGMTRLTFEVLRNTSFCALMRSSDRARGLLGARWPENPCFWPDLLRFALRGDLRGLVPARLVGVQLIARDFAQASGAYA